MIVIRDREADNIIEEVNSIEEGQALIIDYEVDDRNNGTYEPNFYEVVEL